MTLQPLYYKLIIKMELNLDQLINNLLGDLDVRSRNILKKRFGLNSAEGYTLASLGQELGVTRERIRQIESQSLAKIRSEIKNGAGRAFFSKVKERLNYFGGVRRFEDLNKDLSMEFAKGNVGPVFHNQVRFLIEAAGWPAYGLESRNGYHLWYADKASLDKSRNFCRSLTETISAQKADMLTHGRWDKIFAQAVKSHRISESVGLNFIATSKKFGVNPYGDFGLSSWSEIKPKTMRDKSYLILKKQDKPLHFEEITRMINMVGFDKKIAHPPTVHNELIRDERFVLVGRGIYGLREKGYLPGTARETIARLLSTNGPMDRNKLMRLVSEERLLKPNTIFLNLQNRKYFKRLSDGRYTLV